MRVPRASRQRARVYQRGRRSVGQPTQIEMESTAGNYCSRENALNFLHRWVWWGRQENESLLGPQLTVKITSCQSATFLVCVCVRVWGIQKWYKKLFSQCLLFWQPLRSGNDSWQCLLPSVMLAWLIVLVHISTVPLNVINHLTGPDIKPYTVTKHNILQV